MLLSMVSFGASMYSQYSSEERFSSNFYFCMGFFTFVNCILVVTQIAGRPANKSERHSIMVSFWRKLEQKIDFKTKTPKTIIDQNDFINLFDERENLVTLSPDVPDAVYMFYHKYISKQNDSKKNLNRNNKYHSSTDKNAIKIIGTNSIELEEHKDNGSDSSDDNV